MTLVAFRTAVDRARPHGGPALARALVDLVEREPALGRRTAVVRTLIDEAAAVLTAHPDPALQARLLLRLAYVRMVELDLEAAERSLERAGATCDDEALRFWGAVRACRVAIRRGERERPGALLLAAAARLADAPAQAAPWPDVATELALGIAELEISGDRPDPAALEAVDDLEADATRPDVAFTAAQLRATHLLSMGQPEPAARALRVVLRLCTEYGSPADEVEARLALAGALTARGDAIGLEEASRHVQAARELARRHDLAPEHVAALIGDAGILARRGKVASAIDRCLEIARLGAAAGDSDRLVAAVGLMAELYAQTGDYASAYRAIAEAYHGLRDATGVECEPLFRPHLAALRDRMGQARFDQLTRDVRQARQLASMHLPTPTST